MFDEGGFHIVAIVRERHVVARARVTIVRALSLRRQLGHVGPHRFQRGGVDLDLRQALVAQFIIESDVIAHFG